MVWLWCGRSVGGVSGVGGDCGVSGVGGVGEVSCHSSNSLERDHQFSTEVIKDTEGFIQFEGIYSLFSTYLKISLRY